MKRLLIWWRTKVHWFWRWNLYIELAVVLFYLVEDARGFVAWKSFLADQPQFAEPEEGFTAAQQSILVTEQLSFSKLVDFPEEFSHWKDRGMRTSYFDRRKWREVGTLNFPLNRFRNCSSWDLASQFAGSELSDDRLVSFKNDRQFLQLESAYKANMESFFPLDDPDKQALLYFVTRWQVLRAQALWQLGDFQQSHELLLHCIDLIKYLNNGQSVERANQAADDVMSILQIVWQYLLRSEHFSDQDLQGIQLGLESLQFESTAKRSAEFWAISECNKLDSLKWDLVDRLDRVKVSLDNLVGGEGSLEACAHTIYQLFIPNGWIDHSKINICRQSQAATSSSYRVGVRWAPTQIYVTELNEKLDARPLEAYVRCAIAAVSLELVYRETGLYPGGIDKLNLNGMDPFDPGKFLKYRIEDERPVIYSIGPNKKDDMGKPRAPISDGDLVWRYQLPEGYTFQDYMLY